MLKQVASQFQLEDLQILVLPKGSALLVRATQASQNLVANQHKIFLIAETQSLCPKYVNEAKHLLVTLRTFTSVKPPGPSVTRSFRTCGTDGVISGKCSDVVTIPSSGCQRRLRKAVLTLEWDAAIDRGIEEGDSSVDPRPSTRSEAWRLTEYW